MSELDKLIEQEKKLKAKIQKAKARERERERKNDTRRKILIGAMVLDGMHKDEAFREKQLSNLDRYLTKKKDRDLFDLPELNETEAEAKRLSDVDD